MELKTTRERIRRRRSTNDHDDCWVTSFSENAGALNLFLFGHIQEIDDAEHRACDDSSPGIILTYHDAGTTSKPATKYDGDSSVSEPNPEPNPRLILSGNFADLDPNLRLYMRTGS